MKFKGWHTRITAEAAEAEQDQLFDRPPRPISKELRALFAKMRRRARLGRQLRV